MKPIDQVNAYNHVRDVLSEEEFNLLVDAAKTANNPMLKNGFSISGSREMYEKVSEQLQFALKHEDITVRRTAENIHATAKRLADKGWDGKGTFLTD
ncbi:MAG: hypothetical protein ACPH5P_00285 [Akkermansiaceae bacterium]